MPDEKQPKPSVKITRVDDYKALYANNVLVQSTAWDVTFTFGLFDQATEQSSVKQLASVTIPFGLAKVAMYWLESQILSHEIETGRKIGVRENVRPDALPPLTSEEQKNPLLVKYHEGMRQLRAKFLASLD